MKLRRGSLYVDSNIFLYPIIYKLEAIEEARESKDFLLKISEGSVEACTATITWDEIVWVIRRIFGLKSSIELGRKFLEFPNLKFLSVKRSVILRAQRLMEKYKIKPRDAIHAATALENNIETIVSYDRDFDKLEEIKRLDPRSLLE